MSEVSGIVLGSWDADHDSGATIMFMTVDEGILDASSLLLLPPFPFVPVHGCEIFAR